MGDPNLFSFQDWPVFSLLQFFQEQRIRFFCTSTFTFYLQATRRKCLQDAKPGQKFSWKNWRHYLLSFDEQPVDGLAKTTAACSGCACHTPTPLTMWYVFYRLTSLKPWKQLWCVPCLSRKCCKKLLSYTLRHNHILYCIDNEASGEEEWAIFWEEYILGKARESGKEICVTQTWK